jgi:hypothetical protein
METNVTDTISGILQQALGLLRQESGRSAASGSSEPSESSGTNGSVQSVGASGSNATRATPLQRSLPQSWRQVAVIGEWV